MAISKKARALSFVVGFIVAVVVLVLLLSTDSSESAGFKAKAAAPKWRQEQHKLSRWSDDLGVRLVVVIDPAGQRSNHVCISSDTGTSCNLIPSER